MKVELITRDDTGPNPDKARQLAQELVVRDKVNLLAGVIFTPNAMAMAPIATEAKVPFVIMNAGTSVITTRSPYIVRTSFTLWQSSYPLGQWASKKYKTAYTLVSDFGPGHDCRGGVQPRRFNEGGGKVLGNVRVPLQNPDWAAYMQRVKDAKPDVLMVFIPAGKTATAVMKNFSDLGLDKAGIKLIGPGDITTDEELPNMGDVALGVLTVHHYSAAADRPAEQGVRRGVEEGVRRERDAELRRRRRLRRRGPHRRGDQAAEGQARSRQDDGDLQAVEEPEQPARPDLDRSRDARHRAERVPARSAQGERPARQRRDRDASARR